MDFCRLKGPNGKSFILGLGRCQVTFPVNSAWKQITVSSFIYVSYPLLSASHPVCPGNQPDISDQRHLLGREPSPRLAAAGSASRFSAAGNPGWPPLHRGGSRVLPWSRASSGSVGDTVVMPGRLQTQASGGRHSPRGAAPRPGGHSPRGGSAATWGTLTLGAQGDHGRSPTSQLETQSAEASDGGWGWVGGVRQEPHGGEGLAVVAPGLGCGPQDTCSPQLSWGA